MRGVRPATNLKALGSVPGFIDVEGTIARFGTDPRRLKPSSERLVLTACAVCSQERLKKFRYALKQRLCLKCSNVKNAQNAEGRKKRGNKMRVFYKNGGAHPTKGRGHTKEAKQRMSRAREGKPASLTPAGRERLREHCKRVLNNPEVQERTRCLNSLRRGPLNPSYGVAPKHTRKVWYVRLDGSKVCFRSSWEALFAEWLDTQRLDWQYEPVAFTVTYSLKDEAVSGTYRPDFLVGSVWYEVKGWWTPEGLAKFNAFQLAYPDKEIVVVDRAWLKSKNLFPKRM